MDQITRLEAIAFAINEKANMAIEEQTKAYDYGYYTRGRFYQGQYEALCEVYTLLQNEINSLKQEG